MRCEFKDGTKIDYSGTLLIRKGNEINGYIVKRDAIPQTLRTELDKAVRNESCKDMRRISDAIVNGTPCGKICL